MSMLGPLLAVLGTVATLPRVPAQLSGPTPPQVDWEQPLGTRVPLEARFRREDGTEVALGELLGERPVVLALVYYRCPMLCNLVLDGLVSGLRGTSLDAGEDFEVLVLSIDPAETPELARAKRDAYVEEYGRGPAGWTFLVGAERDVRLLAGSIGFTYTYVSATGEYAHAAGLSILTPAGELSRVLFGSEFAPRDLKLALVEAGGGKIGSPIDKLILRCFHYDPAKGRYGFAILSTVRVAGVATVLLIGACVARMLVRERRAAHPAAGRRPAAPRA
jgi:protein SCO1/2